MLKFWLCYLSFGLVLCCGFAVGVLGGTAYAEDLNAARAERASMRKACIDGNERACRMYEVEHGR